MTPSTCYSGELPTERMRPRCGPGSVSAPPSLPPGKENLPDLHRSERRKNEREPSVEGLSLWPGRPIRDGQPGEVAPAPMPLAILGEAVDAVWRHSAPAAAACRSGRSGRGSDSSVDTEPAGGSRRVADRGVAASLVGERRGSVRVRLQPVGGRHVHDRHTNSRSTTDIDAEETRDWLDSLDSVLRHDGADRARFLLERVHGLGDLMAGDRLRGDLALVRRLVVLAVNLSGAFFMSQAALRHMGERGTGRIVNISSVIGSTGNIGQANYALEVGPVRTDLHARQGGRVDAQAGGQAGRSRRPDGQHGDARVHRDGDAEHGA